MKFVIKCNEKVHSMDFFVIYNAKVHSIVTAFRDFSDSLDSDQVF
jgi:hypothetical protein